MSVKIDWICDLRPVLRNNGLRVTTVQRIDLATLPWSRKILVAQSPPLHSKSRRKGSTSSDIATVPQTNEMGINKMLQTVAVIS